MEKTKKIENPTISYPALLLSRSAPCSSKLAPLLPKPTIPSLPFSLSLSLRFKKPKLLPAMKISKKKKVHPSPSPSPSSIASSSSTSSSPSSQYLSSFSTCRDAASTLNLLPAAIITLISILSLEDQEAFAFIIARAIKTTVNPSSLLEDIPSTSSSTSRKSGHKKRPPPAPVPSTSSGAHKPLFDCGCFDCYGSYWHRWNSSPNRELIHRAFEEFEEYLAAGEQDADAAAASASTSTSTSVEKPKKTGRGKKKEKIAAGGRRNKSCEEKSAESEQSKVEVAESSEGAPNSAADSFGMVAEVVGGDTEAKGRQEEEGLSTELALPLETGRTAVAGDNHKGLARKVLPDVIGLFNSRLWSLWSPGV